MNEDAEPSHEPPSGPEEHAELIAQLFSELSEAMGRIAWSILRDWQLADDAVQETFALFSRRVDQLFVSHGKHNLAPWLVKTVQFHALNLRRGKTREQRRLDDVFEFSRDRIMSQPCEADNIEQQDTLAAIIQAMEQLPPEQRDVVLRRMYHGQNFAEIAAELNTPIGTITSRMRLALKRLQAALKDYDGT